MRNALQEASPRWNSNRAEGTFCQLTTKRSARGPIAWGSLLSVIAMANACLAQVQQFTPSPEQLGNVITDTAKSVLATCQSWPPRLATNASDQKSGRNLQDGTTLIVNQLTQVLLRLDPQLTPNLYDASFLRLLDSVGTTDPTITDDQLLGLAQSSDQADLPLWGADLVLMTQDCTSLLGLAAQANARFSIPLASLDAAFKASSTQNSNQTAVLMVGSFQSPFDVYYNSERFPEKRLFAALKAIEWRVHTGINGTAEYIGAAKMLTVTKNVSASSDLSLVGDLKAGLAIPFANLGGSINGGLTSSLKSQATSYRTYYWDVKKNQLPAIDALSESATSSLPALVVDTTSVGGGSSVRAKANAVGWPARLCADSVWQTAAGNRNFPRPLLTMTPGSSTRGLPTCILTLELSVVDPRAVNVSDPRASISYRGNSAINILLRLDKPLHMPGKPSALVNTQNASWTIVSSSGVPKAFMQWSFPVHLQLADATWVVSSLSLANSLNTFVCKSADGGLVSPMTDARFEGAGGSGLVLSGNNSDFTINIRRTLHGIPQYNDDPNQPDRRQCQIYGSVDVVSVNSQNKRRRTDTVSLQTDPVYFPNIAPASVPSPPAAGAR